MKKCRYAIFDMDGTLIDSMPAWENLGRDYLKQKGIKVPENLNKIINAMSLTESASYFRREFGIKASVKKIISDINKLIEDKYRYEIQLKPYVKKYISSLKNDGITMCIATATPLELAEAALKRLNVLQYFSCIVCCDEIGVGKNKPDVYYLAIKKMGANIEDTMVYEDADYAIKTAKKAGFYTIGVYDETAGMSKEEMKLLCDKYIESFKYLL